MNKITYMLGVKKSSHKGVMANVCRGFVSITAFLCPLQCNSEVVKKSVTPFSKLRCLLGKFDVILYFRFQGVKITIMAWRTIVSTSFFIPQVCIQTTYWCFTEGLHGASL